MPAYCPATFWLVWAPPRSIVPRMTLCLAATTLEKIKAVPNQFWYITGGVIVGIVLLVWIYRVLQGTNKIILSIIIAMVMSFVGFNWVYERNEPAFLTPTVDVLAQFLPTKGMYGDTQKKDASTPTRPGSPKK